MKSGTYKKRNCIGKKKGKSTKGTRKIYGGRKRVENVIINFKRGYTTPNIITEYEIIKGPSAFKGKGRLAYLVNFLRTTADNFEEEIAQKMQGVPPSEKNSKRYDLIFEDIENPMEPGSDKILPKCKDKGKGSKKSK